MRQALTPACLIFILGVNCPPVIAFVEVALRRPLGLRYDNMLENSRKLAIVLLATASFMLAVPLGGQTGKPAAPTKNAPALTADKAIELAQRGRCKEALPVLKRTLSSAAGSADTRKRAGIAGLRCALTFDDRDASIEFLRQLQKAFPKDPDVLFVVVHAYSDLSSRAAQDLGRFAPDSVAAHKLNAEALELQGKWGEAEREYQDLIEKQPNTPGLHFLLGRMLLSRPDADAPSVERAKQEFVKELEIDPNNAGAAYILGEMARKDENWDEAIARFSQAAKLDPNFADAFLGWGSCLVTIKRYEEAIAPLQAAERLMAWNPAVHYTLATALSRSGHKEEAEKEFEIHRSLTAKSPPAPGGDKPQ
jgi:tetratricopeptide (TPR) repeat protein